MYPVSNDRGVERLAASLLVLGLCSACGGGRDSAPGDDDAVGTSGAPNLIYCDGQDAHGFREHYRLSAINRKLAYYPELAAEAGIESVATCEDARQFRGAYAEYSELHPGFDADQPLGPMPVVGPPGDTPDPTFEEAKVFGGKLPMWAYPNSPAVRLTKFPLDPGDDAETCTGTVIAPNWILTAAHCLAQVLPMSIDPVTDLTGYPLRWTWQIDWGDINGNVEPAATIASKGPDIAQYAHPDYMGTGFPEHDLGLLYLYPGKYAAKFPSIHGGGAMRISLTPPGAAAHAADPTYFLGFSSPNTDDPRSNLVALRWGQSLVKFPVGDFMFTAPITLPPNFAQRGDPTQPFPAGTQTPTCKGDSGGPAYRLTNVVVHKTPGNSGSVEQVPVLLGSLSGAFQPDPRPPSGGVRSECSRVGETDIWVRADGENEHVGPRLEWIMSTLAAWGQYCKRGTLPGGSEDDFVQCWGDPCVGDSQCEADEYCAAPGASNSQCLFTP